jgi:hypothetical protein
LSNVFVSSGLILLPTDVAPDLASTEYDDALSGDHPNNAHVMGDVDTETDDVSAPDINQIHPDLVSRTKRETPATFRPIVRGVMRPLIAVITAQYVIVTALAAGVAVTVAHHASHLINEKFAAIITALKRL